MSFILSRQRQEKSKPHTLIIGGGFAGLYAAKQLARMKFPLTLVDKQNYHLFQPLLYQVATGFLAPGDISSPLRSVLAKYKSASVIQDEIIDLAPDKREVYGKSSRYSYDYLVIATGVTHSYFGNESWSELAPGLKTVEDARSLRSLVLSAFEAAERSSDDKEREKILTFAIIGGGPTGVELAGALAELARGTLKREFRRFDPALARIVLLEAGKRLLPSFSQSSSDYAARSLESLGVDVQLESFVVDIKQNFIKLKQRDVEKRIETNNIIWAAGVKASSMSGILKQRLSVEVDNGGKIKVETNLSLKGYPNIFVIGDLASLVTASGQALPGLAPVAMQEGAYVAKLISSEFHDKKISNFKYTDKGNMAVIGRGRAVAEVHALRVKGFPAWLIWALVHIYFLIEFENKVVVFFHWAWNYLSNKRGSRLITGA